MRATVTGRGAAVLSIALACALLATPAYAWTPVTPQVDAARDVASAKLAASDATLPADRYPWATLADGHWRLDAAKYWTSGFLPGQLWLQHEATGASAWRASAVRRQVPIAPYAKLSGSNDLGFMLLTSYGNGYRLTGDPAYKTMLLTGAASLSKRFNPKVGMVRSINTTNGEFWVNSDTTMNIALLFRGASLGGPTALRTQAESHARRVMRDFIRPDGGTRHLVVYNESTGAVIRTGTIQGYSADSTWSRGQAWIIYGLGVAYRETGDPAYLAAVHATSDYWAAHVPADLVPPWDFDAPGPDVPRDSSAAAIAASAFLELAEIDPDPARRAAYADLGRRTVESLASDAYLASDDSLDSILAHGTAHAPAGYVDQGTSWGDYYFLEAIARLRSQVDRLGGPNRYATAIRVSQVSFESANTVVVVSGTAYPDAVSASALAGVFDAPVLLTDPLRLSAGVGAEIARLGATRAIVVGGGPAVSAQVAQSLDALPGVSVERIAGPDRYATSAAVARRVAAEAGAAYAGEAFVVRGDDFADALAISPIAYAMHAPVLLTRPGALPAETRLALTDIGASEVRIIGGTGGVSASVASALAALTGTSVDRIQGVDRYATAAAVSEWAVATGRASRDVIGVTSGLGFADALAGGAAIGARGGVLLLTRPTDLSPSAASFLAARGDTSTRAIVFGGDSVVSGRAAWGVDQALSR